VIACAFVLLAVVQVGSEAIYGRLPVQIGVRIYQAIDAVAPADYVSDGLAMTALRHGDLDAAEHYAIAMPAGPRRDDLLAQVAQARGEPVLAREYYFAAADVVAMQRAIAEVARYNLRDAEQEQAGFRARLIALGTHPDAVAESYWLSGNYAAMQHRYLEGLSDDEQALVLAPMNMAYILSAANNAYQGNDVRAAQRWFERGVAVDPGGGDAYAGLGLIALRAGDRARAQAYLERARAVDPHAQMIPALAAALR